MAGRGGYQAPDNPAPISGPGALSQRTDGGAPKQPIRDLPNAPYGANKQFTQLQQAVPLPSDAAPPAPGAQSAGPPQGMPQPVPLTAGTVMPDQPVTHGADSGPGPDSSSLALSSPAASQYQNANSMLQSLAANPMASPALQQLAAKIKQTY